MPQKQPGSQNRTQNGPRRSRIETREFDLPENLTPGRINKQLLLFIDTLRTQLDRGAISARAYGGRWMAAPCCHASDSASDGRIGGRIVLSIVAGMYVINWVIWRFNLVHSFRTRRSYARSFVMIYVGMFEFDRFENLVFFISFVRFGWKCEVMQFLASLKCRFTSIVAFYRMRSRFITLKQDGALKISGSALYTLELSYMFTFENVCRVFIVGRIYFIGSIDRWAFFIADRYFFRYEAIAYRTTRSFSQIKVCVFVLS